MRQDHEDEQDLEHHGGDDEEVHGDEGLKVVVEERAPGLRRRRPVADQILGDRRLRDLDAQLLEFPVNPRRAPQGVGARHSSDERSHLRVDARTAWPVPAALPGPEEFEDGTLPPDHYGGLDDGDGIVPAGPTGDSRTQNRRSAVRSRRLVKLALAGQITNQQGAAGSKLTIRQFQRVKARYRAEGVRGLLHCRRGQPSPRALPSALRARVTALLQSVYRDSHES